MKPTKELHAPAPNDRDANENARPTNNHSSEPRREKSESSLRKRSLGSLRSSSTSVVEHHATPFFLEAMQHTQAVPSSDQTAAVMEERGSQERSNGGREVKALVRLASRIDDDSQKQQVEGRFSGLSEHLTFAETHYSLGLPPSLELRFTPSCGYGLFATEDIPRGTRILAETPFIYEPARDYGHFLWEQLSSLNADQILRYTELSSTKDKVSSLRKLGIRQRLQKKYHATSGDALDAAVDDMIKLHNIYFNNAVIIDSRHDVETALFLLYSRVNHSCLPNVDNSFNATINKHTVHASKDIKAGEELFTSYIRAVNVKADRQHRLQKQWGFQCQCRACHGPGAFASEVRRQELSDIEERLADYDAGRRGPLRDDREALEASERMTELLKAEGLVGSYLSKA